MHILTTIVAQVLRMIDARLDVFVTVDSLTNSSGIYGCNQLNVPVYAVSLTECGQTLVSLMANHAMQHLGMINHILPGLFANEA